MPSRDFFTYGADFLPLAASSTATVRLPIMADSAFVLAEIAGSVKALSADEVNIAAPAITVQLQDETTGRLLSDRPIEWVNIVGTAQRPFVLPQFKTFAPNSSLNVTLVSLIASARQVRLAFIGYKLFLQPGEDIRALLGVPLGPGA